MRKVAVFTAIAAALVLVGSLFWGLAVRRTPLPNLVLFSPEAITELFDRHGRPLRTAPAAEVATVTLDNVSPQMIAATLAAEDVRFLEHRGVDYRALVRGLREKLRGRSSSTATITEQLVAEPVPRTLRQRLRQILRAARLEQEWNKKQILEAYMNSLDYGPLQQGIAAASATYFAKPPSDLTAAEAAFLAALPRAPNGLDPHDRRPEVHARQQMILERMAAAGAPTPEAWTRAREESLAPRSTIEDFAAPHFIDHLLRHPAQLPAGRGPLHTTLDLGLNQKAEEILAARLPNDSDAVAIVLHNPTGDVLALAGRRRTATSLDSATHAGPAGSTVLPFTYLLALEEGAYPGTVVADVPANFIPGHAPGEPGPFHGPVSLRHALANSLPAASAQILEIAGGPRPVAQLRRALGLTSTAEPSAAQDRKQPLDDTGVQPLALANAYATLARGGHHLPPRLITGDARAKTTGHPLFGAESAYLVADMLADNRARAAAYGHDSDLELPFPTAVKTGTFSGGQWIVGFTPQFTVAVRLDTPGPWPGRDPTPLTAAALAWRDIFLHLNARVDSSWFARPGSVQEGSIHPLTGRRIPADRLEAVEEIFVHLPPEESPEDYDEHGRVVLPSVYREWLEGPAPEPQSCAGNHSDRNGIEAESLVVMQAP